MQLIKTAVFVLLMVSALSAAKTLDMYVVDVEGGKSLLLVSPSGQSMVIDAGGGREANRIAEACKAAGVKKIDYMVVSHYDGDHVGGVPALAERMPIVTFVDHGANVQLTDPGYLKNVDAYMALAAKAKRLVVKAGDKIPIQGFDALVVMAAGKAITEPLKGAGQPNPACGTTPRKVWGLDDRGILDNHDTNENSQAITLLVTYGKFRMLDPADLTWNKDRELMCPMNRVGTVDLYMTANHGTDNANSPIMVHALRPRVVIADNGARKGASAEVFQTVESSPGLEDYWQMHYLIAGGAKANVSPDYIANLEGSPDGEWIKVSVEQNGAFTVTNARNNFSKTYKPRK
ncbi:MAG: MBL fold metallo-hydrolase [Bryobacteraceae bacterium]|jgi:beta-lactamase superfamily II metal-dependent hydrolase